MQTRKLSLSELTAYLPTMFFLGLFGAVTLITVGVLTISQVRIASLKEEDMARQRNRAKDVATELESHLIIAQQLATTTANLVKPIGQTQQDIEIALQKVLRSAPSQTIYGVGAWYEPFSFSPTARFFGPYAFRNSLAREAIAITYDWSTPQYNYHQQSWYLAGKNARDQPVFSEPYFDTGTVFMTVSQAFGDNYGGLLGVTTVDMVLPLLRELISKTKTNDDEIIYVTTAKKAIFVHPHEERLLKAAKAQGINPRSILDLDINFLRQSEQANSSPQRVETSVKVKYTGWSVTISTSESYLFRNARNLQNIVIFICIALWSGAVITYALLRRSSFQLDKVNQLESEKASLQVEIAERKRIEKALRQAEEKYRSIFENAVEGIFQATPDGRYISANPALSHIYGYESPEALIANLTDVAHQLYVDPNRRVVFMALMQRHDVVFEFESQIYRGDGSDTWISESAKAVRDENGTLLYYEGIVEDVTERKRAENIIRYQAFHDSLTDLPNRLFFNESLSQALMEALHGQGSLAVMFIDLDRFKRINDTLGHAFGDRLLQSVAQRLSSSVDQDVVIARWGGDEFTLLLPRIVYVEEALETAQGILDDLKPNFNLDGQLLHTSCSIGIAIYPADGEDAETLIKHADTALYQVKNQGGNAYQLYTKSINPQTSELLTLEYELHRALDSGELTIYYQPQVSLKTGEITGMEALARWKHPTMGLVSPKVFIPLAEENGLIVPLSLWAMQTACRQNKLWQEMGLPQFRVAINLSARQFRQADLVMIVEQVLSETGLCPQWLELEITETIAMENAELTKSVLEDLHQMGVRISIDDFGTGYSSLCYLKQFPIHTLKIDRTFIQDLPSNQMDAAIASAIITLGRGLNLNVIAEGVETEEQLKYLRSLHCDEIQGYLFSKPLPCDEATRFLQTHSRYTLDLRRLT